MSAELRAAEERLVFSLFSSFSNPAVSGAKIPAPRHLATQRPPGRGVITAITTNRSLPAFIAWTSFGS